MNASSQNIDTAVARAYEQHMVPGMFAHWTKNVIALAAPRPGEHVLDVACGTGIGARAAAQAVGTAGRIAGVDVDPGVIELARELTQGSAVPMDWHCASALKMPFTDGEFDLCLCLQGLQFFPDRLAGLAEMRRVLRKAGRLAACVWGPLEFNKGHHVVVKALERQKVDASAAKRACSLSNAEEIRAMVLTAGFSRVELKTQDGVSHFASVASFLDGMTLGSPSTRHAVALLSDGGRQIFFQEVKAALEPYLQNGELAYPMRNHLLIAST